MYLSTEEDGILVFQYPGFQRIGQVDLGKRHPRGIALTPDGRLLFTADRDSGDLAVTDTASLTIKKFLPIGKNPEFVKVDPTGRWVLVSYEPSTTSSSQTASPGGSLPYAHVVAWEIQSWKPGLDITAGLETEGMEFSQDGRTLLLANEGDSTLTFYDFPSGKLLKTLDVKPYGYRPRGLKRSPDGRFYAVSLENSSKVLLLDADRYQVSRQISTDAGPYGLAWDPKRGWLVVSAARAGKLEAFDPSTGKLLANARIGARGWHFSYTPDGKAIVVACGRSRDLHIIDADRWKEAGVVPQLPVPWGILAFPLSAGSLGLP
jgi:DNA-binding beta-propeller fold protein YncE